MDEIVGLRQENAKTFDLGGQKRGVLASVGSIHYKDDYSNLREEWKEINLDWQDNKITRAPYELTLEGKKLTIRDKKTGEVSIIELTEIGGKSIHSPSDQAWEKSKGLAKAPGIIALDNIALDTDLEIVAENGRVKFTRVLKSNKAPLDAKFRVAGNWVVKAKDTDGEIPVETSLVDGILTEILKPDRTIRYPVRIDPTLPVQVAALLDDTVRAYDGSYWGYASGYLYIGYDYAANKDMGSAARFLNITIPAGSVITLANLKLTAGRSQTTTTVNARLRAQANISPATFIAEEVAGKADFDARTWTTAYVNWDAIPAWTSNTEYTSPDIKTCIQEVINLSGWASGNAIVVLVDDFEKRSDQEDLHDRAAQSYDNSTTLAPKLYIEYNLPGGMFMLF